EKYLTSYGEHYFDISKNHFLEFWDYDGKLKNTWFKIDELDKNNENIYDENNSKEIKRLLNIAPGYRNDREAAGHITIIFSAMCLEAIINHYAISRSSKSYFENYLDKLEVRSKWIIFPKLFSNAEFNRDSQAFQLLDKVVTLRNNLVHYKSHIIEYTFAMSNNIKDEENKFVVNVKDSIKAMICVIDELKRIDPNWNEYKWYSLRQKESPVI
ncbi:MAG: hypothetical protein IIC76_06005, partial [Bacteroidetes bacterium]|nr:hypothetical protein [Bacteroidota bacterium]